MIDSIWQDVRYAARSLRRTPGFTAAAVLTLALGIGANTAIFTLLDAVMFKPLQVPAPDELVVLYESGPDAVPDTAGGTGQFIRFSYPRFKRLEQAFGSDGSLAATTRGWRLIVRLPGRPEAHAAQGQLVSGRYFATLGISIARGRPLPDNHDSVAGNDLVVVISDGFWKRTLGAAPDAIGRALVVNGVPVIVAGIAPAGFVGVWTDAPADLWLPVAAQHTLRYRTNSSAYGGADRNQPWAAEDRIAWLNLIARVPQINEAAVHPRLQAANRDGLRQLAEAAGDGDDRRQLLARTLAVEPLSRGFSGTRRQFSTALYALTAMVAIVLLVSCANIANLLLARATGRAREMGIRLSLGATKWRLIRQCLADSVVLATIGGALGLLASQWASDLLARAVLGTSAELPPAFSPDSRVLLFNAGLAVVTAILFGLAPATRAARSELVAHLVTTQRQAVGQRGTNGMRPLVAVQLALSFVLVLSASLLGRTVVNILRTDPGFATEHRVMAALDPDSSGYTRDQIPALGQRIVAAARSLPGVTAASLSTCGLMLDCSYSSDVHLEGLPEVVRVRDNWVGPAYFAAVGIPLVRGREFDDRDTERSARVAIVSESIARRYFAGQDPIGKRLGFSALDTEIVGLVRDARAQTLRQAPVPMVYFPISQPPRWPAYPHSLEIRFSGDAGAAVAAVRDAIRRAEPGLLVDGVTTIEARMQRSVVRERLVAWLASAFSALTLFQACLGLYGVLSYAVERRRQEIGVRLALGASPRNVAAMVVRDALRVIVCGLFGGVVVALWTMQAAETLLFGVSASDAATYAIVVTALATSALTAAYLPARRAGRVDPATSLRAE